jgi:hypothetical protein
MAASAALLFAHARTGDLTATSLRPRCRYRFVVTVPALVVDDLIAIVARLTTRLTAGLPKLYCAVVTRLLAPAYPFARLAYGKYWADILL